VATNSDKARSAEGRNYTLRLIRRPWNTVTSDVHIYDKTNMRH